MRPAIIVDTNVAIVANRGTDQASEECIQTCIRELRKIRTERRLLIDQRSLIMDEYRRYLSPTGQPGVGDAWFKLLWNNQANEEFCRQVPITPTHDDIRMYAEFPEDPDLAGFDRSDQKFVAVAVASGEEPPILNASDRDWWDFGKCWAGMM